MRLGFEESVAIVADFLYPGQPQVQQIISPTSVLAVHFLWSRFLPRGPLQEYCPKRKDLVAAAVEALHGRGYPISVSGEGASCSEVSVGWGVSLGSGSRILSD